MRDYVSTHQVARWCQVSRSSVIRWIHEGRIPAAVTPGGHHRVHIKDVLTLLHQMNMQIPPDLEKIGREDPGAQAA